jgi:ethanolamine permease
MAVFGAVVAYVLQMVSFVLLRLRFPQIDRPYRSPVGSTGAILAGAIAAITLWTLFRNADYNKGVIGAAVWFVLGIGYYVARARRGLVLAPEEQTALAWRKQGPIR